jgi:hypothetical protein
MTTNDIENLAAGFVLGMIGSVFTWLLIARTYRPKFEVSQIARSFDPATPTRIDYRFKVLNKRSKRAITDLGIECRVFIQGLNKDPNRESNFTSFHIPIGDRMIFPYLEKGKGRIYRLRVEELEGGREERLPQEVFDQVHSGRRTLEQLLRVRGEKAYVRIVVTGADEFSGFRWSNSPKVVIEQIIPGTFESQKTIEIRRDDQFAETPEEQTEQPGDQPHTTQSDELKAKMLPDH